MGESSKIEWTDATFNAWIGCTKVSPACDNCYAESMARRRGWHDWNNATPRKTMSDSYWRQPRRWDRQAAESGRRRRVFCSSLADVFDPRGPAAQRDRLWQTIAETPNLDWQLLTKRPNLAARFLPVGFTADTWPNVWLGVTAEDQTHYDRRWPHLADIDTAVRFVSYEPMLGPLTLRSHRTVPDWVIAGGESGPGARTFPDSSAWARDVRDDCHSMDVAFFFKQWGTYGNHPLAADRRGAELIDPPDNGKGGALLDGRLHREFPLRADGCADRLRLVL